MGMALKTALDKEYLTPVIRNKNILNWVPKSGLDLAKLIILKGVPPEGIPQKNVFREIHNISGRRISSIASTLNGPGPDKLSGQLWFDKFYKVIKFKYLNLKPDNQIMIMNKKDAPDVPTNDTNYKYNNEEKQKSREFAVKEVINRRGVKILTMPGPMGEDVKQFLKQNDSAVIVAIERDERYHKSFVEQKYGCESYRMLMEDYLRKERTRDFDCANIDINGHLSKDKVGLIKLINEGQHAEYVVFTFTFPETPRGKSSKEGYFAKMIKDRYANEKYKTLAYLKDALTNYEYAEMFLYKTSITPMGTFKFKRKSKPNGH